MLLSRIGIPLPFTAIGPKRLTKPALVFHQLPRIDLILLSHAHFDHFDWRTLRRFNSRTRVVTAARTRDLLRWTPLREITELRWGETHEVTSARGSLRLRAIPVRHWGARLQTDMHRGYNGYVIERNSKRVIFEAIQPLLTSSRNSATTEVTISRSSGSALMTHGFARIARRNRRSRWRMPRARGLSCRCIIRLSA